MKPLGPLTTYGVGGPAALFVEIDGPRDLERRPRRARGTGRTGVRRSSCSGGARTCWWRTRGFDGIVRPPGRRLRRARAAGPGRRGRRGPPVVRAGGAGAARWRAGGRRRVAGLAWAVGVPGSVGGAVRMNAGGHGSDMASCLVRYRWVDLLGRRWHR